MHLPRAVMASLTSIIIPLYQYPPSSTSCWPDINAVLQASGTSTQFIFIANPSSGPIVDPTDLYLRCLPSLRNQGAPVSLVGYVRTGYGSRSVTDVQKDVQTYESWKNLWVSPVVPPGSSNTVKRSDGADDAVSNDGKIPNEERSVVRKKKAKKASKARKNKKKGKQARKGGRRDTNGGGADPSKATLGLEGIFFDEVSQEAKDVATYAGYAKEVRSGGWKSAFGQVIFNPGLVPDPGYFALADFVITFEDAAKSYSVNKLATTVDRAQQGVIIHSFPTSAVESDYNAVLAPLIPSQASHGDRVGLVYITTVADPNPYDPVDGKSLGHLAAGVIALNNA